MTHNPSKKQQQLNRARMFKKLISKPSNKKKLEEKGLLSLSTDDHGVPINAKFIVYLDKLIVQEQEKQVRAQSGVQKVDEKGYTALLNKILNKLKVLKVDYDGVFSGDELINQFVISLDHTDVGMLTAPQKAMIIKVAKSQNLELMDKGDGFKLKKHIYGSETPNKKIQATQKGVQKEIVAILKFLSKLQPSNGSFFGLDPQYLEFFDRYLQADEEEVLSYLPPTVDYLMVSVLLLAQHQITSNIREQLERITHKLANTYINSKLELIGDSVFWKHSLPSRNITFPNVPQLQSIIKRLPSMIVNAHFLKDYVRSSKFIDLPKLSFPNRVKAPILLKKHTYNDMLRVIFEETNEPHLYEPFAKRKKGLANITSTIDLSFRGTLGIGGQQVYPRFNSPLHGSRISIVEDFKFFLATHGIPVDLVYYSKQDKFKTSKKGEGGLEYIRIPSVLAGAAFEYFMSSPQATSLADFGISQYAYTLGYDATEIWADYQLYLEKQQKKTAAQNNREFQKLIKEKKLSVAKLKDRLFQFSKTPMIIASLNSDLPLDNRKIDSKYAIMLDGRDLYIGVPSETPFSWIAFKTNGMQNTEIIDNLENTSKAKEKYSWAKFNLVSTSLINLIQTLKRYAQQDLAFFLLEETDFMSTDTPKGLFPFLRKLTKVTKSEIDKARTKLELTKTQRNKKIDKLYNNVQKSLPQKREIENIYRHVSPLLSTGIQSLLITEKQEDKNTTETLLRKYIAWLMYGMEPRLEIGGGVVGNLSDTMVYSLGDSGIIHRRLVQNHKTVDGAVVPSGDAQLLIGFAYRENYTTIISPSFVDLLRNMQDRNSPYFSYLYYGDSDEIGMGTNVLFIKPKHLHDFCQVIEDFGANETGNKFGNTFLISLTARLAFLLDPSLRNCHDFNTYSKATEIAQLDNPKFRKQAQKAVADCEKILSDTFTKTECIPEKYQDLLWNALGNINKHIKEVAKPTKHYILKPSFQTALDKVANKIREKLNKFRTPSVQAQNRFSTASLSFVMERSKNERKLLDAIQDLENYDLHTVIPVEMFGYQKVGVAFAEKLNFRCIIGDDMGLGKTVQGIASLALSQYRHPTATFPALILSPVSVVANWKKEIAQWLPEFADDILIFTHRLKRSGDVLKQLKSHKIHIAGYETYVNFLSFFHNDPEIYEQLKSYKFILADELHRAKNPRSGVGQACSL